LVRNSAAETLTEIRLNGRPASCHRLPLYSFLIHLRLEKLESVTPAFFGVVHRRIRILDERFGVLSVFRVAGTSL
jgi:hypothetical protein